jgi:hypothetical protein
VQGVGEKWLFSATSRGFGYGYEAVRIRVKAMKIQAQNLRTKLLSINAFICPTQSCVVIALRGKTAYVLLQS